MTESQGPMKDGTSGRGPASRGEGGGESGGRRREGVSMMAVEVDMAEVGFKPTTQMLAQIARILHGIGAAGVIAGMPTVSATTAFALGLGLMREEPALGGRLYEALLAAWGEDSEARRRRAGFGEENLFALEAQVPLLAQIVREAESFDAEHPDGPIHPYESRGENRPDESAGSS